MRRRLALASTVLICSLTVGLLTAVPAAALDSSNIKLATLSVNQGSPVGVQIDYLYSGSSCKMFLDGSKDSPVKTVPIRRYKAKASLSTAGLPVGNYVVRVNCGKDGKATSAKVGVIPKGAPTRATCDVTEMGFSAGADGETSYGVQITNRSPLLTATSVKLAIAYLDAVGNTMSTETSYVMDVAPGESVYDGGYESVTGVGSIRIDAVCESSTETPLARMRGQAQYIRARNSSIYPTEMGGMISNPFNFIIASSSELVFVTRNAGGQITGGGQTYLDAFIPVGATGTWEDLSEVYPQNVASVDWVLSPRKE